MSVNILIYVLVVLFGSSSWLSTNSIWMELSLLTKTLPEGWSLPSYLAAVVQVACIGPLIYSIIHKCTKINVSPAPVIFFLLLFCTLSTFFLAFLWQETTVFLGRSRSVALILLTFSVALVNSTSNVLFLPYMASFHSSYLTAYFVGMGLSALVPSIVSLLQNVFIFGVREYNFIMFGWMCLATIAFFILHWYVPQEHKSAEAVDEAINEVCVDELVPLRELNESKDTTNFGHYSILIVALAWICAQVNSIVPSTQSYAALPYSLLTYHLSLTFSNLVQPITSFLPLWFKLKSITLLIVFTVVMTACTSIVIYLALQSPNPPLKDSVWGAIISVGASVASTSFGSFLRTVITGVIREDALHNESRLFWCGVAMQVGSFTGACVMFPLVNVFNIFHSS